MHATDVHPCMVRGTYIGRRHLYYTRDIVVWAKLEKLKNK